MANIKEVTNSKGLFIIYGQGGGDFAWQNLPKISAPLGDLPKKCPPDIFCRNFV